MLFALSLTISTLSLSLSFAHSLYRTHPLSGGLCGYVCSCCGRLYLSQSTGYPFDDISQKPSSPKWKQWPQIWYEIFRKLFFSILFSVLLENVRFIRLVRFSSFIFFIFFFCARQLTNKLAGSLIKLTTLGEQQNKLWHLIYTTLLHNNIIISCLNVWNEFDWVGACERKGGFKFGKIFEIFVLFCFENILEIPEKVTTANQSDCVFHFYLRKCVSFRLSISLMESIRARRKI